MRHLLRAINHCDSAFGVRVGRPVLCRASRLGIDKRRWGGSARRDPSLRTNPLTRRTRRSCICRRPVSHRATTSTRESRASAPRAAPQEQQNENRYKGTRNRAPETRRPCSASTACVRHRVTIRICSKSEKRPPIVFSEGDDSYQQSEGAATRQHAEIMRGVDEPAAGRRPDVVGRGGVGAAAAHGAGRRGAARHNLRGARCPEDSAQHVVAAPGFGVRRARRGLPQLLLLAVGFQRVSRMRIWARRGRAMCCLERRLPMLASMCVPLAIDSSPVCHFTS